MTKGSGAWRREMGRLPGTRGRRPDRRLFTPGGSAKTGFASSAQPCDVGARVDGFARQLEPIPSRSANLVGLARTGLSGSLILQTNELRPIETMASPQAPVDRLSVLHSAATEALQAALWRFL